MAGPKNECIPLFDPADHVTAHAMAAVVGKRFVNIVDGIQGGIAISDATGGGNIVVGAAQPGAPNFGVSKYDADAAGKLGVIRGGAILPVNASAAIAAGLEVEVANVAGQIQRKAAGVAVGISVTEAAAAGDDCVIALYPGGVANSIHFTGAAPDAGLGRDGDVHVRTNNGEVSQKVAGAWVDRLTWTPA